MYARVFVAFFILFNREMTGNDNAVPQSRSAQIQAQRKAKAQQLKTKRPSPVAKYFAPIDALLRRSPIRFGVDGSVPGAGLTLGLAHQWDTPSDQLRLRLWGHGSIYKFYGVGAAVDLPHIGGSDVGLTLEGSHRDSPALNYYGSGEDSSEDNRTSYRREDTTLGLRVDLNPHRDIGSSCGIKGLFLNVGPGARDDVPPSDSVFSPDQAPGIDVQNDFLIAGCAVQLELRDFPGDPHEGTYAAAAYGRYFAEDRRFSFHRLSGVVEHYIPFLNRQRVVALRAKTELSFHPAHQEVPFYLQPALGGDADLRGFQRDRFHDENSILLNAEYRWEVSTRFDTALFADAGKVFSRVEQISLKGLETSAGFGLRFKSNSSLVVRLDTGFSREGIQLWLRFGRHF